MRKDILVMALAGVTLGGGVIALMGVGAKEANKRKYASVEMWNSKAKSIIDSLGRLGDAKEKTDSIRIDSTYWINSKKEYSNLHLRRVTLACELGDEELLRQIEKLQDEDMRKVVALEPQLGFCW